MRIALFADTYLPGVNGVSRTLARLVRHAGSRGHEVALITPRIPAPEDASPVEEAEAFHYRLPGIPVPLYPKLTLARPLDAGGREALREFGPEVIHVATESTVGWSGWRWALKRNVPLVTSFHTDFAAYVGEYGLGLLERPVWRYLRSFHDDAVMTFCPSTATRTRLWNHGFHGRIRVWSRGTDAETFSAAQTTAEGQDWSEIPDGVLRGWKETAEGDPSLLQSSARSVTPGRQASGEAHEMKTLERCVEERTGRMNSSTDSPIRKG